MIRLLLVEDSAVQRELLSFIIEEAGGFELVGTAADGLEAVEKTCALRPDIILMDCYMPRADGIEATKRIMAQCPTPIVIVSATLSPDDVRLTFDAIKSGALAIMPKPGGMASPDYDRQVDEMISTLRLMSEIKVVGRRTFPRTAGPSAQSVRSPAAAQAVAIVGSTGAPGVIADILGIIGPEVAAPILVVQHIARGFAAGFARWLGEKTGLDVTLPDDGIQTQPGSVYIAPDDYHMTVDNAGRIHLVVEEPEEGFRPSGNPLFRSMAKSYGARCIGVLLTGMGRDGATGLLDIRRAGGITAAQDEASCTVFGMPREAIRLEAAQHVLPPSGLARLIVTSTSLQAAPNTAQRSNPL